MARVEATMQLRLLAGEPLEEVLQEDHAAEVDSGERCCEQAVDDGAVDDDVDIVDDA